MGSRHQCPVDLIPGSPYEALLKGQGASEVTNPSRAFFFPLCQPVSSYKRLCTSPKHNPWSTAPKYDPAIVIAAEESKYKH